MREQHSAAAARRRRCVPSPPPAAAAMDTDTEANAASTGTGPKKGFTPSHVDVLCDSCGDCVWQVGQSSPLNRELSRHINSKNGSCRPDGIFKPAKEAKMLTEQMITNCNLFEVRGARECDFLRQIDADDSHECSNCQKLFPTLDQAEHHAKHTKCKQARPAPMAMRVHCHITIGGTLVRAVASTRRRLDSAFAAAPVPATPAIRPAVMAGTASTGTSIPPAPAYHHYTNSGEYMYCIFDIFCRLFSLLLHANILYM